MVHMGAWNEGISSPERMDDDDDDNDRNQDGMPSPRG